jgi:hypothetical protein
VKGWFYLVITLHSTEETDCFPWHEQGSLTGERGSSDSDFQAAAVLIV